jgi:hypothetical protein
LIKQSMFSGCRSLGPFRKMVGATGFEPATSWSQTRRSTKLSYTPTLQMLRGLCGVSRPEQVLSAEAVECQAVG